METDYCKSSSPGSFAIEFAAIILLQESAAIDKFVHSSRALYYITPINALSLSGSRAHAQKLGRTNRRRPPCRALYFENAEVGFAAMVERRRLSMLIPSKENVPPLSPFSQEAVDAQRSLQKTAVSEKIAAMRDRWVGKKARTGTELAKSPTLVQLQRESEASAKKERPGKSSVLARQRELERLHHEAKSRLEGVGGVGGGVSLWPAMDDMRLSMRDAVTLAFLCLFLTLSTAVMFLLLHG